MKTAKATMGDVAKRAGVSPSTVARVLYANGYVTAEKRAIVQTAIRETGYRPNVMARALRTAKSFTMGMVVSEVRFNAFHSYVAHEVQLEALKHGYTMLTLNNNASTQVERAGVQRFLDQHVDAIVFCAAFDPANVRLTSAAGVPTVQIEREVAAVGSLALVDPQPGMSAAIEHLIELGHRRIAFLGGSFDIGHSEKPAQQSVEAMRLRSFEAAMAKGGLRMARSYVKLGRYARERGYRDMAALLDVDPRPTAVIAGSDLLAAAGLQAINERGLRVPDDLSLIGYDDTMAEILTPPLTSIAQPVAELGQSAVALALNAMRDVKGASHSTKFPTRLVIRASTTRPPDWPDTLRRRATPAVT